MGIFNGNFAKYIFILYLKQAIIGGINGMES